MANFCFSFTEKMAPKSTMVEFRRRLLKKPHDGGDASRLVSFEEPKISSAPRSPIPEVHLPKKQEGKKVVKAKETIKLNFEVPLTSKAQIGSQCVDQILPLSLTHG